MSLESAIEQLTLAVNKNTAALGIPLHPPGNLHDQGASAPVGKKPPTKAAVAEPAPTPATVPATTAAPTPAPLVKYEDLRQAFLLLVQKVGRDAAIKTAADIMAPLPNIKAIEGGEQRAGQYAEVLSKIQAALR